VFAYAVCWLAATVAVLRPRMVLVDLPDGRHHSRLEGWHVLVCFCCSIFGDGFVAACDVVGTSRWL
jgi:hypothetical protein